MGRLRVRGGAAERGAIDSAETRVLLKAATTAVEVFIFTPLRCKWSR